MRNVRSKVIAVVVMCALLFFGYNILFTSKVDLIKKFDVRTINSISVYRRLYFPEDGYGEPIELNENEREQFISLVFSQKYKMRGKFDGDYNYGGDQIRIVDCSIRYLDSKGNERVLEFQISNMKNIAVRIDNQSRQKKYSITKGISAIELFELLETLYLDSAQQASFADIERALDVEHKVDNHILIQ